MEEIENIDNLTILTFLRQKSFFQPKHNSSQENGERSTMLERINWRLTWRGLLAISLIGSTTLLDVESVRADRTRNDSTARGWPGRRISGGSRTGCLPASRPCSPVMALVPDGLLRTTKASPTLLFYLPSLANPRNVRLEFVLRDENDRLVYEKTFTSNGEAGILEFAIEPSANFPGLENDRSYQWYLSIIRDPSDRARDEVVEGWIQRVPLQTSLARQLEQLSPVDRVKWYESENLQTEALSELAKLKRANPENGQISRLWRETIAALALPPDFGDSLKDSLELSRSLPIEEIH